MQLEKFLNSFFADLQQSSIDYCVLRNYEYLPEENKGNDIDFLINPHCFSKVIEILSGFEGIVITGIVRRQYVNAVFLYGIEWKEYRSIELDFVTGFSWKGFRYLDAEVVLKGGKKYKNFFIPSPAHESIISLLSSLIFGGFIKEKYIERISGIFEKEENEVITSMNPYLGSYYSKQLVADFLRKDYQKILSSNKYYKAELLKSNFKRRPLNSIWTLIEHFRREILIRLGKKPAVVFLGPDGAGKSTIINKVKDALYNAAKPVEIIHLRKSMRTATVDRAIIENPHNQKPRGYLASFLKLIYWVSDYKLDQVIRRPRVLTLRFYDRYYHDLLIDPKRYRYKGSESLVRFFSLFVPNPILWVILTAPPEMLHARKQEVLYEETVKQIERYKEFHNHQKNSLLIDTSQSIDLTVRQISESIAIAMNRYIKF
ncbi:MAG: hypothetical protein CV087_21575 [Candidatus Brocadia sp. WS118]|nr:MAG: hypothetical protein CV087_21575 [Candidatus Brocadia sp. WS118]